MRDEESAVIEVVLSNGDWAEAETDEAFYTALQLHTDATEGRYHGRSKDLTATFKNAITGEIILAGIPRSEMVKYA